MLSKTYILTFLLILIIKKGSGINESVIDSSLSCSSCECLIEYRDNLLSKAYQDEQFKFVLNKDARDLLLETKKQLLDDTWWVSSTPAIIVAEVGSIVKTTTDLIGNLLGFDPATGRINRVIKSGVNVSSSVIRKMIEEGKSIDQITRDEFQIILGKEFLDSQSNVYSVVFIIIDLVDGLAQTVTLPQEFERLKGEIQTQIIALEKAIDRYNLNMQVSRKTIGVINELKKAINEECGIGLPHDKLMSREFSLMGATFTEFDSVGDAEKSISLLIYFELEEKRKLPVDPLDKEHLFNALDKASKIIIRESPKDKYEGVSRRRIRELVDSTLNSFTTHRISDDLLNSIVSIAILPPGSSINTENRIYNELSDLYDNQRKTLALLTSKLLRQSGPLPEIIDGYYSFRSLSNDELWDLALMNNPQIQHIREIINSIDSIQDLSVFIGEANFYFNNIDSIGISNFGSSMQMLSMVAELFGDEGKKTAMFIRKYGTYGMALHDIFSKISDGESITAILSSSNYLQLSFKLLGLTEGLSQDGLIDQMILNLLKDISRKIDELREHVDFRFNKIENKLDSIYSKIDYEFTTLKSDIAKLQTGINQLLINQNKILDNLKRLDIKLDEHFKNERRLELTKCKGLAFDYLEYPSLKPTLTEAREHLKCFDQYARHISTLSTFTGTYEVNSNIGIEDIKDRITDEKWIYENIKLLTFYAEDKYQIDLLDDNIISDAVNPFEWTAGCKSTMKLMDYYPDILSTNSEYKDFIERQKVQGLTLSRELKKLQNKDKLNFYLEIIDDYRKSLKAFLFEKEQFIKNYENENLRGVDLFNPFKFSFKDSIELRNYLGPCSPNDRLQVTGWQPLRYNKADSLAMIPNIKDGISEYYLLGAYLGLGSFDFCYKDIQAELPRYELSHDCVSQGVSIKVEANFEDYIVFDRKLIFDYNRNDERFVVCNTCRTPSIFPYNAPRYCYTQNLQVVRNWHRVGGEFLDYYGLGDEPLRFMSKSFETDTSRVNADLFAFQSLIHQELNAHRLKLRDGFINAINNDPKLSVLVDELTANSLMAKCFIYLGMNNLINESTLVQEFFTGDQFVDKDVILAELESLFALQDIGEDRFDNLSKLEEKIKKELGNSNQPFSIPVLEETLLELDEKLKYKIFN